MDITYARKAEEESIKCQATLEDRLLALQRDLEARYKHQLESELALYRNREIAKVRQEERDGHREELAKEKESLHCQHQLRLEEGKKSEQRMTEKYRRKEQVTKWYFTAVESTVSVLGAGVRGLFSAADLAG